MELSQNALKVLEARYLLRDEEGRVIETPEQMFARLARVVAATEAAYGGEVPLWERRFHELLGSLKFLPNSPAIMNAGKAEGQLAACFVLPVEDSMQSIFDTLKNAALILQSGGGTGFSFSQLRPKADPVRSTGGIASGPVSFMKIYNTATDVIKQGGARRGANMGILRVDHPDILEFIRVKRDAVELANFNISVAVTDAFMEALRTGGDYPLVNPRSHKTVGSIAAAEVFAEIVASAWSTGDPGLIFIDRINRANPTPLLGSFESTNPCGEQPLLPYEACVLGSLNLSRYALPPGLDWAALGRDVATAVRFLDDTIDANHYPLPAIEAMHKGNRKIGLGVMGWADLLILLGLPYNDPRSFALARQTMRFVRDRARAASVGLAEKRGVFPNFIGSIYDAEGMPRVRNATTTTIAPTGTLATIADCSSGIEPLFSLAYQRRVLEMEFTEINRHFLDSARKGGFYSERLMAQVLRRGTLAGIPGVPPDAVRLFQTALEIPVEGHLEMQAAFQEYTDNAVSKTVNLPESATEADVARTYLLAYEKGVKGVTVFRYGAKKGTLLRFEDID
ncbi:adenosylcobalamin-dependent ribonucleoside-diphosphate reductase [Geomesophilobacter sediminis]|uniref:Vitamin B12-dependent ribonucleotide reductase n=1 Tax=Geomesophilobacter sediminis TaxID=2798584 RepID=A0A8J7J4I7_9BACT|nr:adenosylcobalamin-dependent ribonucleoside-diphosphate reductase [Geomesophilobacter sediminis]MBJ6725803.1 adenosylcobalamin-dependent ribonucleoside-diphosphate reductase [Geomesophilobacter sediminis]